MKQVINTFPLLNLTQHSNLMGLTIICSEIKIKVSYEEQRKIAHSLIYKLTGEKLSHSNTGRPIIDKSVDVSISHKDEMVCAGIVNYPYRLGIDVEHVENDINTELFLKSIIAKTEIDVLEKFCENNQVDLSAGIATFWSIKEAFFKCLDYDFKPNKINICEIDMAGNVGIDCSEEITRLMRSENLNLCLAKLSFNKKYIHSCVVMKKYLY